MATAFAFVDSSSGVIHSLFTGNAGPAFPESLMNQQEPATPDGCIRVSIPATIITTDAIKAESITESPGFVIVDDEDKLAELRARALPHIRETRNQLMAMCDWRVMPDSPLSAEQRAEWNAYRQALRDFPVPANVINPVWPTMPSS